MAYYTIRQSVGYLSKLQNNTVSFFAYYSCYAKGKIYFVQESGHTVFHTQRINTQAALFAPKIQSRQCAE